LIIVARRAAYKHKEDLKFYLQGEEVKFPPQNIKKECYEKVTPP